MTVSTKIVSLDANNPNPLVDQIVCAVQKRIDDRVLRGGMRMPSIRTFASNHEVSRFTVVTAYDRLVAMGYLQSRQGSGFYVAPRPRPHAANRATIKLDAATDVLWLLRNALAQPTNKAIPGAGWFPRSSVTAIKLRDFVGLLVCSFPRSHVVTR